jgi:glycosyltransferase involved in cell wall biosynthesis
MGFVDDLPAVYRGASALVSSSRSEGFGLPALEAMACGTPVVAFANTSAPEVLGSAGVLVADGDVAALVEALGGVISEPVRAAELSMAGIERAKAFDWDRTVAGYVDILTATAAH